MSALRSIAAIVCGFSVIIVSAVGTDYLLMAVTPDSYTEDGRPLGTLLGAAFAYSFVFSMLGGYTTAVIAGRARMLHVFALAVLMLGMTILATVQMYEQAPLWWHLTALGLTVPAIMTGGWLYTRKQRRFYNYSS